MPLMLPFNFLIASHGCDFVVEEVRDFHSADSMELGVFANPNDKIVLEVAFPRWICVNYLTKGEGWGKSGASQDPHPPGYILYPDHLREQSKVKPTKYDFDTFSLRGSCNLNKLAEQILQARIATCSMA